MKKSLILLATLMIASLSIAGTKEDYASAKSSFEKNQNVKELQTSLEKIVKSKTVDEYTRQANLDLAVLKINENKLADAKAYLNKVVDDKNASKDQKVLAYSALYQVATMSNNNDDKIKYIDKLVGLEPTNMELKIAQVVDYTVAKNSKYKTLYTNLVSKLKSEEKEAVNGLLSNIFLESNELEEAKKYANYNINSKNNDVKAAAYFVLSQVSAVSDKLDEAIKYANTANNLLESKNKEALLLLAQLYTAKGENEKAFTYYEKLKNIDKSAESYLYYIIQAQILNKKDLADKAYNELKATLDENEKKELNLFIAQTTYQNGLLDISKIYAERAVKDDKKEEGHLILALIYANKNDKANALTEIKKAKDAKIQGASELEKQINEKLK